MQKHEHPSWGKMDCKRNKSSSQLGMRPSNSIGDDKFLGEKLINHAEDEWQTVEEVKHQPTAWGKQQCFTHQDFTVLRLLFTFLFQIDYS